jgi:hypothetical protein
VLAALAVVALFWNASEQHYLACLDSAPQRVTLRDTRGGKTHDVILAFDAEDQASLRASIHKDAECSHLPFF